MTTARLLATTLSLLISTSARAQPANDRAQALDAINEVLLRSQNVSVTNLSDVSGNCRGAVTSQHKRTYSYKAITFDAAKGEYGLTATQTHSSISIDHRQCRYGPANSGARVNIGFKRPSFADLSEVTFSEPAPVKTPQGIIGSVDRRPIGATWLLLKFGDGRSYTYLVDIREPAEATELRSQFLRLKEIDSGS
jgi:hypothetical protein